MPPFAELNPTGAWFETLFKQAWRWFREGEIEKSERLCRDLLLEPRLGDLHRAGLHMILAGGQDHYVYHAEQAVHLYEHMYDGRDGPTGEEKASQDDLIKTAQHLLERARSDHAAIEADYEAQVAKYGKSTTAQRIEADLAEVRDAWIEDDEAYAVAMKAIADGHAADREKEAALGVSSVSQTSFADLGSSSTSANPQPLSQAPPASPHSFLRSHALEREMEEMRAANSSTGAPDNFAIPEDEDPDYGLPLPSLPTAPPAREGRH